MLCPRCSQGSIIEARIRAKNEKIFLCEECEATWFKKEHIRGGKWVDYGTYMQSKGLKPLWNEIDLA
ncbi:hypothetical protein QWZ13_18010 [Reinekea marina]|uniref:hypothetical protein n=1 Tax=Reinekea marina TaxID=1310421 RepID=UPI0025B472CD|nr:hypothetical protein [Reinekea marina]MDN3649568.1 hypothetical protein [Reinekea marina]MDN3650805.1 hypothetical protein [Reinekea marina]